jgi:hypothetical protein
MVRLVLLASIVLAALASSAVLLAWPGDRGEIVGGAVQIPTGRTAVEWRYQRYGLLKYVTVIEHCGTHEPRGWSTHFNRPRAVLTGALVATIWAATLMLLLRRRGGRNRNAEKPPSRGAAVSPHERIAK